MWIRANIVLACSQPDLVYALLADELGVGMMTVNNVRSRFAESRVDGLVDRFAGRPKVALLLSEAERIASAGPGSRRRHTECGDCQAGGGEPADCTKPADEIIDNIKCKRNSLNAPLACRVVAGLSRSTASRIINVNRSALAAR